MSEPNADTDALGEAARRITAAYDPSDPTNLVGMMVPHEGELREIVDAAFVDGEMRVRFAAQPESVTLTITTHPIDKGTE